MRKAPPRSKDSEEENSLITIKKLLFELQERVATLEDEVFDGSLRRIFAAPVDRRKGRRPKLAQEEVLKRHKSLTTWIESSWPELSVALRKARNADGALSAMLRARGNGSYPFQPPFYHRLEQHKDDLWSFLQSGRYHGNPRTLAGAMAGLPELSWKRSLDICSRHPYQGGMQIQAYWDYFRRKFPDKLQELMAATNSLQVRLILNRSRTKDPVYLHLRENPEQAVEWLRSGQPKRMDD
jgi:hypothetical protein